jgi:hypothetical protein
MGQFSVEIPSSAGSVLNGTQQSRPLSELDFPPVVSGSDQISTQKMSSLAMKRKRGGADTLRNAGKMRSPVVLGRGRQDAGRGVGV